MWAAGYPPHCGGCGFVVVGGRVGVTRLGLVKLGSDLGIPSPAAALSLVVPPLVFQFVQESLLVQF